MRVVPPNLKAGARCNRSQQSASWRTRPATLTEECLGPCEVHVEQNTALKNPKCGEGRAEPSLWERGVIT